jgi:hypothetical protein
MRWGVASLALVSVLHTSIAVHAQAPARAQQKSSADAPSSPTKPEQPAEAAASVRDRARTAYGAGQDSYAAGQYATAEAHFALADSLVPAVQAKFWRAMSLDQLGKAAEAFEAFGRVLAAPDKDQLGADKLSAAEQRHRALAATPAELTVTTTPTGAHINVSGVDLTSRTPLSLRLAPGRHVIRVSLEGYEPQQLEITATPGAKLTPTFALIRAAARPAPGATSLSAPPAEIPALAPSTPTERSRVPGYVTLGIAGASAVVGTIFGVRALGDKEDFKENATTSKADDVERNALIADMAFGVALTLGITGIVLLIADDPLPEQASSLPTPEKRASLRVLPYATADGAGAAATLTF